MKGKILLLLLPSSLAFTSANTQLFSLSDTTIVFKSQEGRVLAREEVTEFMKGVFSVRQENSNGKKVITIIPSGTGTSNIQQAKTDRFRQGSIGKSLEQFRFTDLDETEWDLQELKGKIVLLNFWFTACKPCILEMPALNQLVAANRDSVVFLAPAPENESQIRRFLKKYSFDYHIIPSSVENITALKVESFPTHFVVDKQGIVRQVFIGYADDIKEKLQFEIDKLR